MKARLPKQNMGGAQNMNAMIRQAQKMQDEITTLPVTTTETAPPPEVAENSLFSMSSCKVVISSCIVCA